LLLTVVRLLTTSEIDRKLSSTCSSSWGLIRCIQCLNEYKSDTQSVPLKEMNCCKTTTRVLTYVPGAGAHSLPR
jgi:hypothetical protein